MEDLLAGMQAFLNNPAAMAQLQTMAASLGMGEPSAAQSSPIPPPTAPPEAAAADLGGGGLPFDLDTLLLLQRGAALFGQEDDNIRLLRALQPHFSPKRAKKVEDAIRVLQLLRLLPLLRESGLLSPRKETAK